MRIDGGAYVCYKKSTFTLSDMSDTLYLADTCSLSNVAMRDYWEHHFFTQPDRRLSILFTVMCELKRRAVNHQPAQAALSFLEAHASAVEVLPEQNGYPAGSVADCEIVYHCALWKDRSIVLYTEDQDLTAAVKRVNPQTEVYRHPQSELPSTASPWYSVYVGVADNYEIYLTAACVNSPVFAMVMEEQGMAPLFRGKMMLSTTSLPLLNEQGREILRRLEQRQLAPILRLQGRICVTEREELSLRLLTHKGSPAAMLWLGETEEVGSYLEQSQMQFSALHHKGYTVAILRDNGSLDVLQQSTAAASKTESVHVVVKEEKKETAAEKEEPTELTTEEKKKRLRDWLLQGAFKQIEQMLKANPKLIQHAVNTCLDEKISHLSKLLECLQKNEQQVPAKCITHYITQCLPPDKAKLKTHLMQPDLQKSIRKMMKKSRPAADKHEANIEKLQQLRQLLTGAAVSRVQNLIDLLRLDSGSPQEKK